jgi:uncharacterized membrane protein
MKLTRNNLSISCLIFSFIGFLDAAYLTIYHYKDAFPPCTLKGCDTVLASQYSVVMGIPISLFGAIFFVVLIAFALAVLLDPRKIFAHGLFLLSLCGLFFSAILFFIQVFVLSSFCQYCLLSELVSLFTFISCSLLYSKFLRG